MMTRQSETRVAAFGNTTGEPPFHRRHDVAEIARADHSPLFPSCCPVARHTTFDAQVFFFVQLSFGVGSTKSATMVFGPLRGSPDCCVHLGGVPLPLVQQYRYLGIVFSPTLSWHPHVDFLCSRKDRLFHQASAWCLGEGLLLSSVFVTYVLSSSSFGLEFIADDPPALPQFNLALRRWCRHLLGCPTLPL